MSKLKKNATSFKKGRNKTGGRKAGTPNKTTLVLREAVLTAAEAAGNEVGDDGLLSYLMRVALDHPSTFMPLLARVMPQQIESQQTSPPTSQEPPTSEELRTPEEICEHLRQQGAPLDGLARLFFRAMTPDEQQRCRSFIASTDDRSVEDDASHASTRAV